MYVCIYSFIFLFIPIRVFMIYITQHTQKLNLLIQVHDYFAH